MERETEEQRIIEEIKAEEEEASRVMSFNQYKTKKSQTKFDEDQKTLKEKALRDRLKTKIIRAKKDAGLIRDSSG